MRLVSSETGRFSLWWLCPLMVHRHHDAWTNRDKRTCLAKPAANGSKLLAAGNGDLRRGGKKAGKSRQRQENG